MSVPTKQPEKTPREWLRYAKGDLDVAEREMAYTSPSYHTVCFLCQSASEKFLKGYTSGRYPGDVALEVIGPDEAEQAIQSARRIRDAVLARLSTSTKQKG